MIQYNITTKIDPALAVEWLEWQDQVQIPEIMNSGCFDSYQVFHLLDQDESEGPTYIIQFISSSLMQYEAFDKKHAARMNQQAEDRWGRHLVSYQSFMELVH